MADTYGVVHGDVSNELKALFAGGYGAATNPTAAVVTSWITAADVVVTLHVQRAAAKVPASTDQAVPLAKRYILAWVKAQVMRAVYAGNDPESVERAARDYVNEAKMLLAEIDTLGEQMAGSGTVTSRVRATDHAEPRELLVTDARLEGGAWRERAW